MNNPLIYVVSNSVGETAELVVKAATSQFNPEEVMIKRIPYVEDTATLSEVVSIAKSPHPLLLIAS